MPEINLLSFDPLLQMLQEMVKELPYLLHELYHLMPTISFFKSLLVEQINLTSTLTSLDPLTLLNF